MKKKLAVFCAMILLLSGLMVMNGHASGIMDFFSRKDDTVTISKEEYERLNRYAEMDVILQYIEQWYYQEPDVDKLIENATRGLLYGLEDPYTFYYNDAEWTQMWEDDGGEYAGIGIQMLGNTADYTVTITRVFKDTPAERAGIKKGDLLVRVEDIEVDAYSMQNAVNVMRGKVDEIVEVEVKRGDEYLTFRIPRAVIHVNQVDFTMLKDQVGYIVLYDFAGECQKEFSAALEALKAQGAKALVVDLRDNPGGWVDAAQDVGNLFLEDGVLVYSMDRYGTREELAMTAGMDDIPLVMLVNGNSASSSEILAGGLQDRGRATLVGVQTYGKGILQAVIPLNQNKEGFQMTYAQYYLPSGKEVHKVGITPDIICEMPEELANENFPLGDMSDPQLKTAWETAKGMIQE
ncbi:MAG: S41 family peptidase [Clostridia bacterium]|nr:S41 family peptidase [Clostridia bacterium]